MRQQIVDELLKNPNKTVYNLSNDYLFKKVFSDSNNSKIILKRFFNIEAEKIEVLNTNLYKEQKNMYAGVVDLMLRLDDNTITLLEMQNVNKYNFEQRLTIYSAAIIFIEGLKKSEDFKNLKKYNCLAIVNFDISKKDLKEIRLKTVDNEIVGKNLSAKIINLKRDKFNDLTDELFKVKTSNDLASICKKIDEEMLNIISLIVKYNREDEEKLREIEELMLNEKLDLSAAEKYGEQRGEERGISIEKENVARNLLKQNIDINIIMNVTNLSKNKILSLK